MPIATGQFPSLLKTAAVVPIFKKGDQHNIDNYRPIPLLRILSKIFERFVYNRILRFLIIHHILTDCQHGFRPGLSTESGTVDLVQHIYDKLDQNHHVIAILFDLTRAFDTIDITFVCNKIFNMGLRGTINEWVKSFLSDRKIIVKSNEIWRRAMLFKQPERGVPAKKLHT